MPSYDPENAHEIHEHVHSHLPSDPALRVKAMESLLVEKGLLTSEAVDAWVETYSEKIGPKIGASIVARAWCDGAFRARLIEDSAAALKEIRIEGWFLAHLNVVENTESVHNLVVCTLCSCYPHGVLGLQPSWYKKEAYRSRAVRDPRSVLSEFGVDLPDGVQVKVWDSTAEVRYLVLPQRPSNTNGWDESELAKIVTRNSMIGTERDLSVETAGG